MIAAFQGRCPTCGHDGTQANEEFRKWFESRVHLEEGCEVGVGQLAAPLDDRTAGDEPSSANAPSMCKPCCMGLKACDCLPDTKEGSES